MKVYTGGGDKGKTSLFSGERVAKSHERVDAYGDIDELSSFLGALAASIPDSGSESGQKIIEELYQIQSDLLGVGAILATTPGSSSFGSLTKIGEEKSKALEEAMDRMDAELPPLKTFILPGGHMSSAWAHIARTVCRRAERRMIGLFQESDTAESSATVSEHVPNVLVYINRLSDYLFVVARYCNHIVGTEDVPWKK
ncbi:MAG: cob(I)yrinic acid a,c-diamide adenosyltransferase [Deltaproteobacteria bacterium]|nr:cob(I)yrinic acid a,c-diamide adenosyltransferase [Deltaproteobacteria bacterium]